MINLRDPSNSYSSKKKLSGKLKGTVWECMIYNSQAAKDNNINILTVKFRKQFEAKMNFIN